MTYKIETSLPVTNPRVKHGKWPLKTMEVGESFVIPSSEVFFKPHGKDGRPINRVIQALQSRARYLPDKQFTCRTLEDKSVRVWRVK